MAGPHRALVVGALGRMGCGVRAVIAQTPELRLGAALESAGHPRIGQLLEDGIAVGDDAKAALSGCDVAIDFSVPAATVGSSPNLMSRHRRVAGHQMNQWLPTSYRCQQHRAKIHSWLGRGSLQSPPLR